MMTILGLYWKPIAIFAITAMLMGYIDYLKHETNAEKAKNVQLQILNTQLVDDVQHWQNTVTLQNQKIDDLNAAFNLMSHRVEDANLYIQKLNVESATKLDALKKYYESIPESDSCEAVKKILDADIPTIQ